MPVDAGDDGGGDELRAAGDARATTFESYETVGGAIEKGRAMGLWQDEARTYAGVLAAGIPDEEEPDVVWNGSYNLNLTARSHGATLIREFRRYNSGKVSVEHAYFELDDKYQRGGHAKRMMRSSLAVYDAMGVTEIELHANLDVGGYSWARMGFVPANKRGFRKNMLEVLMDLRERRTNIEDLDRAIEIVEKSEDEDIAWELARTEAGKKVLLGSDWHGSINLADPKQRKRLEESLA